MNADQEAKGLLNNPIQSIVQTFHTAIMFHVKHIHFLQLLLYALVVYGGDEYLMGTLVDEITEDARLVTVQFRIQIIDTNHRQMICVFAQ